MPTTAQIRFTADSADARRAVDQLETELEGLERGLRETSTETNQLGRQSRQTTVSVESLEQQIREIQRQSLQYRVTMTQLNNELAQNNNAFRTADAAAQETLKTRNAQIRSEQQFLRVQQQTTGITLRGLQDQRRGLLGISNSFQEAGLAARTFNSIGRDVAGLLNSFGVVEAAFALQRFAGEAVRAAATLEGYERGLALVEGSNAPERLQELVEVANLPGLQLDQLINFSNRLRTVGLDAEDVDKILLTTGQTILSFGGDSHVAAAAVEQLTQAISTNTVSMQDFRAIAQRIPGFYQAVADTHDVQASIDGFRVAVDNAGGSVAEALLPVMDTLAMRFGSPPADSYVVAVDALQNSFFLLQAAIGSKVLPTIADFANNLAGLFENITGFLNNTDFATKSADEFTQSISGTTDSVRTLLPELDEYIRRLDRRRPGSLTSAQAESLEEARDLYRVVSGAIAGNTEAVAELETRVNSAKTTLDEYNAEQERLKAAIDAVDPSIREERDSLRGLNEELAENTRNLAEAQSDYDSLRSVLTSVTEEVNTIRTSIAEAEPPTTELRTATTRLTDSIRELPSEITAVSDAFAIVSPFAEQVRQNFEDLNRTLVDSQREAEALAIIYTDLQIATNALNNVTDAQIERGNLVDPVIRQQTLATREYASELSDLGVEYREVDDITQDVLDTQRNQISTVSDLTTEFESAVPTLDIFDQHMQGITDSTVQTTEAFFEFSNEAVQYIDDVSRALDPLISRMGDTGREIDSLVSAVGSAITGDIPGLIASLADIILPGLTEPQRQLLFQQPVAGDLQGLADAGINLDFAGALDPENFNIDTAAILRAFGLDEGVDSNFFQFLDPRAAQARAEATGTDRQAIEDVAQVMYDEVFGDGTYAAEVAAATAEGIMEGVDMAMPDLEEMAEQPALRDVFRLPSGFGSPFAQLEGEVSEAEDIYQRLLGDDDASPVQLAIAYNNLTTAQTALFDAQQAFIEGATGITEQARTQALASLDTRFRAEIFDANDKLVSGLEDLGFQLTTTITDWFDVLGQAAASFERIPEVVIPEMPDEPEPPEPEQIAELSDVFRFSQAERQSILQPLENDVQAAEDFIRDYISEDSTAEEIQNAYTRLITAEGALFTAQRDIILNATGITEDARRAAIRNYTSLFGREVRMANNDLVDNLEGIGFELVEGLTETSGILSGTRLAVRRVIESVEQVAEIADEVAPEQETQITPLNTDLLENALQRARFNLTGATTEEEFETARQELISAINAFYDLEDTRISGLMLSELELQNQREDNQLARDRDLRQATTATNRFAQMRIRSEMDAAEARKDEEERRRRDDERRVRDAEREAERQERENQRRQEQEERDAERAAERMRRDNERAERDAEREAERQRRNNERAERDAQRIAERTARENQRETEARIREEMRLADARMALIQDAIDAEADYQQERVDLAERTAQEIEDIERRRLRSEQDSRTEYFRDLEDLQNRLARQQFDVLNFSDLSAQQVQQLRESQAFQTGITDIRTGQRRDFADFALREGRGIEDVAINEARRLEALDVDRNATLLEISQGIQELNFVIASTQSASPVILAPTGGTGIITPERGGLVGAVESVAATRSQQEIRADITLNFADGNISVMRDQILRLQQQNRSL